MHQNHVPTTDMAEIAKLVMFTKGDLILAKELAVSRPVSRQVREIINKAAQSATLTSSETGGVLSDWTLTRETFFSALRTSSVFFRLLQEGGLRKVPLRTRLGIATSKATGYIVGEGKPAPLTGFTAAASSLEPVKAMALMVASLELVKSNDPAATDIIDAALRAAVSDAADAKFWELIATSGSALGSATTSFGADLQTLLAHVNTSGVGPLYWAMSPDVGNRAARFAEFMSPIGGEILNLPATVSSAIPAGTIRLLNGAAIAGNAGDINMGASQESAVEMSTTPTDPATASTVMVSLYQEALVGFKCDIDIAATPLFANAMGELSGVAWTGA